MTGVVIYITEDGGLDEALRKLARLGRADTRRELLDGAGALLVSQTQERISSEKASPEGDPWAEWAARTAARRHSGQSLLMMSGALLDSIHHEVAGDEVRVGSGLVYAAIHQFGGQAGRDHRTHIPARPWLGLSAENRDDLEAEVEAFIARRLAA
jgi:phage virion morphogenesis protein